MTSNPPPPDGAERPESTAPGPLANRLRVAMIHLGRRLRHQDPHGMTVTQHLALATIAKRGEMAIGDLAEAERLPSSAATRLADRLEEAGLVARRRDPSDRRGVLVTITEEGRRVMDERRPVGNAWLAGRLSRLSAPSWRASPRPSTSSRRWRWRRAGPAPRRCGAGAHAPGGGASPMSVRSALSRRAPRVSGRATSGWSSPTPRSAWCSRA